MNFDIPFLKEANEQAEREVKKYPSNYLYNSFRNHKIIKVSEKRNESNQNAPNFTIMNESNIEHNASIQAKYTLSDFTGVGYFEVKISSMRNSGVVSIGLAHDSYHTSKQPGWLKSSYGWHSDCGRIYSNSGKGTPYGPTFTVGDVVGCGYIWRTGDLFFTKNGDHMGIAYKKVPRTNVFPVVGMDHSSALVRFAPPFIFPIEELERQELALNIQDVEKISVKNDVMLSLVSEYLAHNGYYNTFVSISKMSGQDIPSGLKCRGCAVECLRRGDIQGAKDAIQQDLGSDFFSKHKPLEFALNCQEFIEIIVKGGGVDEAVDFARTKMNVVTEEVTQSTWFNTYTLDQFLGLLAYTDPYNCPLSFLLTSEHRLEVAEQVNIYLLEHHKSVSYAANDTKRRRITEEECSPVSLHSKLEYLLKQLVQTHSYQQRSLMKIEAEFPSSLDDDEVDDDDSDNDYY
ncbi:Ran-binding protein [Acrasis kona]|uniref:Ran-binding protein n=1 Tax=Acrasis kona TaxID=1008807 RepID=A0AAW2Z614_9EUKA